MQSLLPNVKYKNISFPSLYFFIFFFFFFSFFSESSSTSVLFLFFLFFFPFSFTRNPKTSHTFEIALFSFFLSFFYFLFINTNKQGSEKTPYDVEITVPQLSDKIEDWKGKCDCDNSKNKGKVCSHQTAVLLEWEDQERIAQGETDTSDKVKRRKKK